MRTAYPALLAAVLIASSPLARAANLVQNGSFESADFTPNAEFGASYKGGANVVTDWASPSTQAYNILWDAATADTTDAKARFGGAQRLASEHYAGASPDGGNFVSLDGDSHYNGPLEQTVTGLVPGTHYTLSFYWAATQFSNRTGKTTEKLQVSLGSETHSTAVVTNPSHGFQGWFDQSMTFTASAGSELLSFLSIGTPNGMPPTALLDGVSLVQDVPEPAMPGVLGLGALALAASRRRRR